MQPGGKKNNLKLYKVYSIEDGRLIVTGSANECADALCITISTFYAYVSRANKGKFYLYRIEPCKEKATGEISESYRLALKRWGKFSAAMRKKYGVEPYHGDTDK